MARQIFLVDQSTSMRRIIKTMILAGVNDADVAESQDVAEAMDRLEGRNFHVVLFSRESSTREWLEFMRKRSAETGPERTTAFVLFTSSRQKKVVEEFKAYGVKEHVVIPCSPHDLGGLINRVCSVFTCVPAEAKKVLDRVFAFIEKTGRDLRVTFRRPCPAGRGLC